MTAEVFDELDPLILSLLPELYVAVLTGCDDEVGPKG